jgi:hypothetical protein
MSASLMTTFIMFLIGQAKEAFMWAKQAHGEAIPSWEELIAANDALQKKIDAEK